MLYAICYVLYAICYVLCAICYVLYAICYVLCAIWYVWWCMLLSYHDFPNPTLTIPLTWLSINPIVRIELFLVMHVLGVFLNIPILSTNVYKYHTTIYFYVQVQLDIKFTGRRWSYPNGEHSSGFGRTPCFRGRLPFIFKLRYRCELVEYVPLVFYLPFNFRLCIVVVLARICLIQLWTASFIWLFLH